MPKTAKKDLMEAKKNFVWWIYKDLLFYKLQVPTNKDEAQNQKQHNLCNTSDPQKGGTPCFEYVLNATHV